MLLDCITSSHSQHLRARSKHGGLHPHLVYNHTKDVQNACTEVRFQRCHVVAIGLVSVDDMSINIIYSVVTLKHTHTLVG